VNDTASPALTRFDFTNGEQRGSHLTLYAGCLVHRGDSHLETLPLATIASVRVTYERHAGLLGWGFTLFLVAIVMLLLAAPIAALAAAAAADVSGAGSGGVSRALYNFFRIVEAMANALPVGALAAVIGGGVLAGFGWVGRTVFVLTFAGMERVFRVRGRNTKLLDFSEAVSERLMQVKR
jgi:hypothetical protein